jgi:hypothetical protein
VQDAYKCSNDLRENVNIRLAACVPWRTAEVLTEPILEFLFISRHDPDESSPMPRSVSALVSSGMPTQEDWTEVYEQDKDCKFIIDNLSDEWTAEKAKKVSSCYQQTLLQGAIEWVNGRLCLTHLFDNNNHLLLLIIVPTELQRTLFIAYHAAPSCGHMGRYKTLFRLRQPFFWPGMRKMVEEMISACPHCALVNSRKQAKSEMIFGWPLDRPFCNVHVDLWSAGDIVGDRNQ